MRQLTIQELRRRTETIIDQVAGGDTVLIVKRGVPVAVLRPAKPQPKGLSPQHWERLKKFPKLNGDSGRAISRGRDRVS